eukprot:SAG31_NODE_16409_length_710_cov_1.042553_1_plen_184_part_00
MIRGAAALLTAALAAAAAAGGESVAAGCQTAFDCSLNGLCNNAGACTCDPPWTGPQCATMQYAITPASAKNLWVGAGTNASLNTWNGPIVQGADGRFHLFDPVVCSPPPVGVTCLAPFCRFTPLSVSAVVPMIVSGPRPHPAHRLRPSGHGMFSTSTRACGTSGAPRRRLGGEPRSVAHAADW